jgi:hypothetical protein
LTFDIVPEVIRSNGSARDELFGKILIPLPRSSIKYSETTIISSVTGTLSLERALAYRDIRLDKAIV